MSQLIHLYPLSDTRYILRYRFKVTVPRVRFSSGIHGTPKVYVYARVASIAVQKCTLFIVSDECCAISTNVAFNLESAWMLHDFDRGQSILLRSYVE